MIIFPWDYVLMILYGGFKLTNNGVLDFKPQTWCLVFLFPKQCGHTEGVLTKSVKAWCSIEVSRY